MHQVGTRRFFVSLRRVYLPFKDSTIEQRRHTELLPAQQTIRPLENRFCTLKDYRRLNSVKLSYETAFRLTAAKRDISALHQINDRRSALLYLISDDYGMGMKFITFIRNLPEFKLLNEQDRFVLVKYNIPLAFSMYACLNYDTDRDLLINLEAESEEHAVVCRQLAYYGYGEHLNLQSKQLLRSIKKITEGDPLILQLMMIIMIFTNSASLEDIVVNEKPDLIYTKQVYEAQSIYLSLLFRYMIEKYASYYQAARQYSQLIQKVVQMQMLVRTYQQVLQEQLVNTSDEEMNPISKSILHLS